MEKRYWILMSVLLLGVGAAICYNAVYETEQSRQQLQAFVGNLYEQDPEITDTVLQEAFAMRTDDKAVKNGAEAAVRLGYTKEVYTILTKPKYQRTVGTCAVVLVLLSVCLLVLFLKIWFPVRRYLYNSSYALESCRNRLQEQKHYREQRERQMELYIENIAHQIKTPLAGLLLNLDLLEGRWEQRESGNAGQRTGLQIMEDSRELGEKIQTYIMKLLHLARMEAGKIHFRQEPVELADVLERVQETYAEEKLVVEIDDGTSILVRGDRDWLYEAICNMVENSLQYSGSDIPVHINITDTSDEVTVTVTDRGKGMKPEEVRRFFERYHTDGLGNPFATGIGMNLAKAVIRGHHGNISVESKKDYGTRVKFRLPKYKLKEKIASV